MIVVASMSAKDKTKRTTTQPEPQEDRADGLWVDAGLIARLHGKPRLGAPTLDSESERLLHYADLVLGLDKKQRFVPVRPTKRRKLTKS